MLLLLLFVVHWRALDIRSRGRGKVGATRLRTLLLGLLGLVGSLFRLLLLLAAIFLNQFECRVVLGGILELLDRLGALILVCLEASRQGVDAIRVECRDELARDVDAVPVSNYGASESVHRGKHT